MRMIKLTTWVVFVLNNRFHGSFRKDFRQGGGCYHKFIFYNFRTFIEKYCQLFLYSYFVSGNLFKIYSFCR